MNVRVMALKYAIKAFWGQVRKAEPEKDSVLHSLDVAKKLEEYGFDDNVIAAGYLHDVVEDTDYTIEDIRNVFGDDIASLVEGATEEDKSLSWEERKQGTIDRIKNLDLRHKAVVACDKISNTEDLLYLFGRNGKEDYSAFSRGRDKKLWYWEGVYKSLIFNQDKNLSMFKKLRNNIDSIFYNKNKNYDVIDYKKMELVKLYSFIDNKKYYNMVIGGNSNEVDKIIDDLDANIGFDDLFVSIDKSDVFNKLLKLDMDYLDGKISSDIYIELLDGYINYIWDNVDKIIYVLSDINNNKCMKSVDRILNVFNNNDINFEVVDGNDIVNLCNIVLDDVRKKRLIDVKRIIRNYNTYRISYKKN
ncbi:MAG: HD domain-containing protein [Bacilli bacterium]|nr:HD domain-containing protein [Bacilli bacterium]